MQFTVIITIQWFSAECCKTKTKVITLANHTGHRQSNEPLKTLSRWHRKSFNFVARWAYPYINFFPSSCLKYGQDSCYLSYQRNQRAKTFYIWAVSVKHCNFLTSKEIVRALASFFFVYLNSSCQRLTSKSKQWGTGDSFGRSYN